MGLNPLFALLYGISGSAALLYEIVWLRLLTLEMGHTAAAVGTVLAAFMGGLAAGAWCAGRFVLPLSRRQSLRTYAALEAVVALSALLLPAGIDAIRPVLAWAYANGDGGVLFEAVRVVLSLVLIAIPAAAMGASYPVAVQSLTGDRRDGPVGDGAAGLLYAANTVGATAGAAATGFLLLPAFGLFGTTLVGVALNTLAALGALALGMAPAIAAFSHRALPLHRPFVPSHRFHSALRLAASALALSGFVALVYEVTWTRILAMLLGPTTYAFSAMLVAFIGGLALGSTFAASLARRLSRPGLWLAVAMLASTVAALTACAAVDRLPLTIAAAAGRSDANFTSVFALQVTLAIAMQLPMTVALGAAFPFALALAAADERTPAAAAVVYAANTAGAIAGALAASFILIPRFGLQGSVQVASIAGILGAALVAWRTVESAPLRIAAVLAGTAAAILAIGEPGWNHERMANGAYRFPPSLAAGDIENGLEAGRLSFYREGATGTVSVKELLGVTSLAIDGKVDASNGGDMLTQKLLAHLPLLLHDDPHSVYVIGLGSGVTLGAALQHPIERAVVSEISPEVVAASNAFAKENHQALRDPRVRVIVGDGRAHLLLSTEQYDVIISEPSNPWMAGVSTLFTREFFLAARSHLEPGGILCQWAHTYSISDQDLRSIVATFLSAFPDGSAWLVGESDLLLIGSNATLRALDGGVMRAWERPGVARDLAGVRVLEPFSLLSLFVGGGQDLEAYARTAPVQSDDDLLLEFSAPRAIYGRFERGNVERLRQLAGRARQPQAVLRARSAATAAEWRHRAEMELAADSPDIAYEDFIQALAKAPQDDPGILDGFARAAAAAGRLADAEAYLRARASASVTAAVLTELSTVLGARGQTGEAAVVAQRAATVEPGNTAALQRLISALGDSSNDAALDQLGSLLNQSAPDGALALRCQMRLAYLRGDFARAAQSAERLLPFLGDDSDRAQTLNLLGSAQAARGDHDRARAAFQASLDIAPRDPAVLVNLGGAELRAGNPTAAVERFSEALFLYPTFGPALDGLTQALVRLGRTDRAAAVRRIASR